jgi:hypothetical protein
MSNDYDNSIPANAVGSSMTNAIDAMVAASATQASSVVGVGGRIPTMSSPDLRVNTGTGDVTVLAEASTPSARIPDGPEVDPMGEINGIQSRLAWTQGELDRVVFDRRTGAQSPAITGDDRKNLELQLSSLQRAHGWATQRAAMLFSQREADEAARQQRLNEEHAHHSFTKGDPARAQALADALLRAEADEQAKAIVAARNRR